MAILRSLDDQIHIHIEEGQTMYVGRLPKCDVVMNDGSVSSQHARLRLKDGQLQLVDMESTNGTRVNYAVISEPVYLMNGDTVEFGNVTFEVDGPKLIAPLDDPSLSAMVDLDPLEASQELSATMTNIPMPDDDELDAMLSGSSESPEYVSSGAEEETGPEEVPEEEEETARFDPVRYAFMISLALILAGGLMLIGYVWTQLPK